MFKKRYIEVLNKEFEFFRNDDNYKNRNDNEGETSSSLFDDNDVNFNIKLKRFSKRASIRKSKKQNYNIRLIALKKYFDKFV